MFSARCITNKQHEGQPLTSELARMVWGTRAHQSTGQHLPTTCRCQNLQISMHQPVPSLSSDRYHIGRKSSVSWQRTPGPHHPIRCPPLSSNTGRRIDLGSYHQIDSAEMPVKLQVPRLLVHQPPCRISLSASSSSWMSSVAMGITITPTKPITNENPYQWGLHG